MPRLPFPWVARVLGLLLLLAAGLKLRGLAVDPISAGGIFSSPAFKFAVVEGEIILGIWFISGKNPIGAWLVAVTVFLVFAGVTIYQAGAGVASCGCFGSIRVNPRVALLIDIGALAALALARPNLSMVRTAPLAELRQQAKTLARGLTGAGAVLGLLCGIAYLAYGSPAAALAHLRGEPVAVQPRLLDFGRGAAGEIKEVKVSLVNWTQKNVRVVGGTYSCSFSVTDDLPITIPPGESREVTVRALLSGALGTFTHRGFFYTDDDRQRTVSFRMTGRTVVASNDQQTSGGP